MVCKRFYLGTILRAILLGAGFFLLFYLWYSAGSIILAALLGVFILYLIFDLIRYVNVTNRELSRFFDAIRYEDFSQTFHRQFPDSSFKELYNSINTVIASFRETRAESEAQRRYLQTIVRHIPVGILSFDATGKVELANHAVKRILDIPYITHLGQLNRIDSILAERLRAIPQGQQELVKVQVNGDVLQLSLYATEFKLQNTLYKLVSLQNIGAELEAKEVEAWQNMIRVLAHEILNSVTPISSLAGTVQDTIPLLKKSMDNGSRLLSEELTDIEVASGTIKKRSDGLLRFVNAYRDLARIPQPEFELCSVQELMSDITQLLSNQIEQVGVILNIDVNPESLRVSADPELVEQILLNLVKNAIQAMDSQDEKRIELRGSLDARGHVIIEVEDSGPGISAELQEKVFVPFFSTKKEGSGIGLSFSRQVMQRHGGSIRLHSEEGKGTTARLHF